MNEARAARQLRLIEEVVAAAADRDVEVWLRGGWAMDFFLGEVTRDHRDIDWFTWTGDADVLGAELLRRGFRQIPGLPPDQQIDLVKDGEDVSLNLLRRDEQGRVGSGTDRTPGRCGPATCWTPISGESGTCGVRSSTEGADRDQADDARLGSREPAPGEGRRGHRPDPGRPGPPGAVGRRTCRQGLDLSAGGGDE